MIPGSACMLVKYVIRVLGSHLLPVLYHVIAKTIEKFNVNLSPRNKLCKYFNQNASVDISC